MDKKIFVSISLLAVSVLVCLFAFSIDSGQAEAQTSTYPILNLTLDTLGKTLLMSDSATDRSGDLKQYTGSTMTQDWSVKYEQKGSSRSECRPPVLNVTFSSGTPWDKFHGLSTYPGYSILKYKKVRLIPECDIWNDYSLYSGEGFNGQLNVNLREYSIFKIFRAFGVPTTDIVGFASIKFVTSDPGYAGQSYRYMVVQRDNESSDQIPFTTQFNMDPTEYQSSDIEGGGVNWTYSMINRLTSANIVSNTNGSIIRQLSFDASTTISFLLLTDFLDLDDMAPLHNEDWGINLTSGKAEIIPHGFDASFNCGFRAPSTLGINQLISQLTIDIKPTYQTYYYNIARQIFGQSASLTQMIALINQFPYNDVDKSMLIEYLKLNFYSYSTYFTSPAFATSMNQTYQPISVALPFSSNQEYQTHLSTFNTNCQLTKTSPAGVLVSPVGVGTFHFSPFSSTTANVSFTVDVRTGSAPLNVLKNGSFSTALISSSSSQINNQGVYTYYSMPTSGATDVPGPYYIVQPNSTARFILNGSINSDQFLADTYAVNLISFQPNYKINSYALNTQTNSLTFGSLSRINVITPASGTTLSVGSTTNITWTGGNGHPMQIGMQNAYSWNYISNPNNGSVVNGNSYPWVVGKIYTYANNAWTLTDLSPGQYSVIIQDTVTGLSGSGGTFTVVDPNNVPPSVQISGPSRLAMAYDSSRKESALTSTFKVVVSSGSRSTNIMKNGAFSTYVKTHTNIYSYGASQYPQPSGTIDDGQGNYIISASSSATFTVTTTFNPQNMFAGSYYGILDSVHIGDWSSGQSISVPSPNTTNSIIVIGELSPYIDSITPDPTASNGVISINGSRFAIAPKINTIYVYSKNSPANAIFSAQSTDGLNLKLLTNLTPGDYYIQVLNQDTGLSNNMWLTLTSSTPQYPDITISANPNKVVQGQKSTLSWNALNASYCSGIGWGSASMPTNSSAMIFVKSTRSYVISCANTIPGQGSLISYATTTVSLDAVEISTSSVSSSTAQMESRSRNNGSSMYVGQSSSPSPSVSVSESPSPSVSSSPSPSPSGSSDENGSSPTPVPTPSTTQTPPITPPVQNPVPQKSPTPSPAPAPSSGPESIIPMTSNLTGVIWNSLKWLILRK